jgi:hypothetical protein
MVPKDPTGRRTTRPRRPPASVPTVAAPTPADVAARPPVSVRAPVSAVV